MKVKKIYIHEEFNAGQAIADALTIICGQTETLQSEENLAMKVTLTNDFHNTSCTLIAKDGRLSESQMKKARRELCFDGCTCSGDFGYRWPQEIDGIEPIYDSRAGKVVCGIVHEK